MTKLIFGPELDILEKLERSLNLSFKEIVGFPTVPLNPKEFINKMNNNAYFRQFVQDHPEIELMREIFWGRAKTYRVNKRALKLVDDKLQELEEMWRKIYGQ